MIIIVIFVIEFLSHTWTAQYIYNMSKATRSEKRRTLKSTAKSVNTLRQLLQASIIEEIDDVMQKYIKKYMESASNNIEFNQKLGIVAKNEKPAKQHIKDFCRQILDEAKKMY